MISLRFDHLTSMIEALATTLSATKKSKDLRIRLYVTEADGTVYGFERDYSNVTSINYWIQDAITNDKLPDLNDWEEVKKK